MSDLENTLKSLQISSLSDAVEEIEGILEWKQNCKDVMNKTLLQFFQNREDDNFD